MSGRRLGSGWGACLCVLLWSLSVRADPFHHQPVPLGERALGMGGAFTGVANEPSAAYYNPAGLVRLEDTTLSAGLTLTAFDRVTLDSGYRTRVGRADLKHHGRPSLPLFVSLVKQVGPRDENRRRRHAVAMSTFTLAQRRLDFDAKLERLDEDGRTVVDTFYVTQENTSRWHGVSYAYRLSQEFSFGVSVFVTFSRMSHVEERVNLSFLSDGGSSMGTEPESRLESRRTSFDVINSVSRFAALYVVPHYRLGLTVQPPSFQVRGSSRLRDRELLTNARGDESAGSFVEVSDRAVARDPIPWEVRVGGAYEPTADLTLALDVSTYGPNGSREHPIVAIGPRNVDPESGRAARPGDLALERWYRVMTANVSIGTEYIMYDALVLRAGLFSDLSAAPNLPRTSTVYRPADVHRVGATLSFGIVSAGYDVSLGAVGKFGHGKAMALAVDSEDAPYRRTTVQENTLYVFLTGARRAVGRLVKGTVDRINAPPTPPDPLAPPVVQEEPPAPAAEPPPPRTTKPRPRRH
jgi:hypothetical protein